MLNKLLNFLTDKYTLVYTFFTVAVYQVYDVVNNVWNWIVSEANKAYNRAVNFAVDAKNWLIVWTRDLLNDARLSIDGLMINLRNWLLDKIDTVRATIKPYVDAATVIWNAFLINVRSDIERWTSSLIDGVKALFHVADTFLQEQINNVTKIIPGLRNLLDFFSPGNLTKLSSILQNGYQTIVIFSQDPIGYLFGILWDNFIEFASFCIAYALGTTKYDLPPRPNWRTPGRDDYNEDYDVPEDASSGLTRPVTPLYISGYTFTSSHRGTDFGLTEGQPVFASHSGTVQESGYSNVGYGNTITIDGTPWWTRYAHLLTCDVVAGDQVAKGQVIGLGDSTGNSTGNHLHYEIKYQGQFVDPVSVL